MQPISATDAWQTPSAMPAIKHEPAAAPPSKAADDGESEELTTASTNKVDNEIAGLRNEQAKLLQQLSAVGDNAAKRAELQAQLDRINNELRQKDNDTYRRQNAEFSTDILA